ncbi:MAG: quaternary ammonium transporter [Chloroflexaceae bacterium]|nr:quaternary ammonium transporter [Chloroflexaceae bacterium]
MRWVIGGVMVAVMLVVTACGSDRQLPAATGIPPSADTPIRIGSKDFTEQFILGEMYAFILEDAGLPVERMLNMGSTDIVQLALLSNDVDLYPEYTGTGLLNVLRLPISDDPSQVYELVRAGYAEQFNLIWLDPAPMNNTQALAMTRKRAEELGIVTISDMVAQADQLVMIGPPEFQEREDGLPGLQAVYGNFALREFKPIAPDNRYQALAEGAGDITVAFGTDGEIAVFDLVLLEDDQQLFPPYQVAPVIRANVLATHPQIAPALNRLAPLLDDATMQRLNNEVSGNKRSPAAVAREFLEAQGLIQPR